MSLGIFGHKIVDYEEQRPQCYAGKLFEKTVGAQAPFLSTAAAAPIIRKITDKTIQNDTGIIDLSDLSDSFFRVENKGF